LEGVIPNKSFSFDKHISIIPILVGRKVRRVVTVSFKKDIFSNKLLEDGTLHLLNTLLASEYRPSSVSISMNQRQGVGNHYKVLQSGNMFE